MPDPSKLSEENRTKLDGIVQQMIKNKESDDDINFVVNDFKSKYAEKKNSVGTVTAPKSASKPVTGSLDGAEPKMGTFTGLTDQDLKTLKSQETPAPKIIKPLKEALDTNKAKLQRKDTLEKELKTVKVTPENQDEISKKTDELVALQKEQQGFKEASEVRANEKQRYSKVSALTNHLATGSSQLGVDIASIPELVYDVFAVPQNAVADIFDLPKLRTDSEKFKEYTGISNVVKDYYKGEVADLREKAQQIDLKYQNGIYDSFVQGDYGGGFDQLTNSFAESLPATSSIMVGGAAMKAPQLIAASSMLFGAEKNEKLKDENPEMNANVRVANALATGLIQGATESLGSGSIGAAAKGLIQREGPAKAVTILKDGLLKYYQSALRKNPLLASMSGEGLEETFQSVAENAVDVATGKKPQDYNIWEGAADNFIGGAFGGAVFGAGLKGLQQIGNYQDKKIIKANTKQVFSLQNELQNPDLSPESRSEINKTIDGLVRDNRKMVQKNVEHVEALSPKVREELLKAVETTESIKTKSDQIKADPNTSKETKQILLSNLEKEYKAANERKNNILGGSFTEVDALPLREQDRLKKETLNQLKEELNPDGKKDITISNEQILNRANKNYEASQPKAEVTETVEDVSRTNEGNIEETEQTMEVPVPETIENETQTENGAPIDGDVRPGTDTVEKGTVVELRSPSKQDLQDTAIGDQGEGDIATEEIKSGRNTFIVNNEEGNYTVVNSVDGSPVSNKARIKVLEQHHAENNIYAQGKKAFEGANENLSFEEPRQVEEHILKNSENPSEIAEAILRNKTSPISLEESRDFTDQKIFDALKSNKLDKSALKFGDRNAIQKQKGFSYFAKEKGRRVDALADEINVDPEQVLDFIKRYPRISDFKTGDLTNNIQYDLEQKFEKLTGIKPTKKVLLHAVQQANKLSEDYSSFDAMSNQELEQAYNEATQAEQDKYGTNKPKKSNTARAGQTNENSNNNQSDQEQPSVAGQNFEEKSGVRSISKRLLEGQNSEDVTEAVLASNINYEVDNQEKTWNEVKDLLNEFDSFEMYRAIKNGTITNPSAVTAAYGQLLEKMPDDIENELSKIEDPQDQSIAKTILWDEFGRITEEFARRATEYGQANAMVAKVLQMAEKVRYNLRRQSDLYKAANNGVMDPETQRSFEKTDAELKKLEDQAKTLQQEKVEQEAERAFENMQEEVSREKPKSKKQQSKDLANKIRTFKVHRPGSFSAGTPASLAWDLGVETIAKTVEAGGTITEAIQKGLDKIKNTKWYKNLSEEQQKNASKDFKASFAQDKEGNIRASSKIITTPNGVEFPASLFREYVKQGLKDIDAVAKKIQEDISDEYPDADIRDIRDGLSDYGKTINPKKDDISKEIARQKSIGKLLSAKEDVLEGQMPKKSGLLRAKPDLTARLLRQEINAIMKEKGLDTEDLNKKWTSALTKIKNSLRNQIEELDKQIESGERRKVERTVTELDQDAKDLKSERDQKKKLLDQIAGKPQLTDEQKIKRAERSLEASIVKLQEQIDLAEFDAKADKTPLDSPRLKELRAEKAELSALKKQMQVESGAVEKARLEMAKKRVASSMKELQRRIDEKDYSTKEIKPIRADEELRKLKEEKIRLFEVYDAARYKAELKNRTNAQKYLDNAMEIVNVMRISSGLDLGLLFLQLGPLTTNRIVKKPLVFAKNMVDLFKAMGSEKYSKKMNAELKADPDYPLAEETKLALTSVDYKLSINEDQFTGDLTHTIWNGPLAVASTHSKKAKGFLNKERTVFGDYLLGKKDGDKLSIIDQWKNSNIYPAVERGLITYANTVRFEEFKKGVEMLRLEGKNQEDNLPEYKKMAASVNTLTGRGNLPKEVAGINKFLTTIFFSPRNAVAIVNQVNPFWYASLQYDKDSGFKPPVTFKGGKVQNNLTVANKLAVYNMARFVAITTTFSLLVRAAFGDDAEDIIWNPLNYNAGKIRVKGKDGAYIVFDPWAGKYHQVSMFAKLASELTIDPYTGQMTSLEDADRGSKNRGEILGEYIGNKLSPAASFGWNWATAKTENIDGEDVKVNRYTGEKIRGSFFPSLIPMYWAGFYELQQQDPDAFTELMGVVAITGINTDIKKPPKSKGGGGGGSSRSSTRGRTTISRGR